MKNSLKKFKLFLVYEKWFFIMGVNLSRIAEIIFKLLEKK